MSFQTMTSHSIFVCKRTNGKRNPSMIAYDIKDRQEAEALVRGIAVSYRVHGFDRETNVYWFRTDDALHEIYAYPHD